jgi:hypothetical protein
MCMIIRVPPTNVTRFLAVLMRPFVFQSSFQLAHAGERTNFGRFGAGIYTSATSSKVCFHCVSMVQGVNVSVGQ